LAAIGIVLHHAAHIDFRLGTGRVLLFFVISGYCIAASAESCKRRGMGAGEFFWRRIHRIYPPYVLALLFWVGTRVVKWIQTGQNDLLRSPVEWLQNLTLTQWVTIAINPVEHPGANPTLFVAAYWSLCYEEQFYLIMAGLFAIALAAPRFRIWPMMLGIAAIAMAWGAAQPVMVRGIFPEYWMSFTIGATAYYRLSVFTRASVRRVLDLCILGFVAFSIGGLLLDHRVPDDIDRSKWTEWLIAGVYYFVLIGIRPIDGVVARSIMLAPLRALGRITYSLYLIHQFNLNLIGSVSATLLRRVVPDYVAPLTAGDMHWYDIAMRLVLHIGLALVFWRFCEYPFLNRAVENPPRPGEPPAEPPPPSGFTSHLPDPARPADAFSRDG
jgi:peptidoglycan/LPS O-acetylase OafA/YrhL